MSLKMDPNAPIGIFDSGPSGLAVMREVRKLLPNEDILYLGDTLRQPYGPRTIEEVRQFTIEISGYLIHLGVKMILIGCNTASIAGGEAAQACYPNTPIIGMIQPGVKAALQASRSKRIGVWGTEITIASQAYDHKILEVEPRAQVIGVACPTLLRLTEKGKISNRPYLRTLVSNDFRAVVDFNADTLILGCTDFTCVRDIINDVVGSRVTIVDPAEEVAREAKRMLTEQGGLHTETDQQPVEQFFVTGDDLENFSTFGASFLGVPQINVKRVPLEDVKNSAGCIR